MIGTCDVSMITMSAMNPFSIPDSFEVRDEIISADGMGWRSWKEALTKDSVPSGLGLIVANLYVKFLYQMPILT